ncbi:MAG: biotin--[acetyl-CoA-carboxylase] ligase [Acidobacteria bacterium]|nr:biotin--[acetyl-CoA-carboxylase] ligase [Acidobacteriota bacterium]
MSRWARTGRHDVVLLDSVHSTNRLGLEILQRAGGDSVEAWIFALEQHQSRGRFDRSWSSPRGCGVYASRILSVPLEVLDILPMVLGVALCEGLSGLGFDCRLKWPNDIELDGAKVGGILLQSRSSGDVARVVAGLGVNHSHALADLPWGKATSLALAQGADLPSLVQLSIVLADAVEAELERQRDFSAWSAEGVMERYREWCRHRPGELLEITIGEVVHRGEFVGFSKCGHLRLRTTGKEMLLAAGEVTLGRAGDRRRWAEPGEAP